MPLATTAQSSCTGSRQNRPSGSILPPSAASDRTLIITAYPLRPLSLAVLRSDEQGFNEDSSMTNSSHLILAVALIMLGSCGRAPPLTKAEDQRIDQPMARAKAEQDRTYHARTQGQAIGLESRETPPIVVAGVRQIPRANLGQHSPPEMEIPPSSGNTLAP